jgi:hypothetical protein
MPLSKPDARRQEPDQVLHLLVAGLVEHHHSQGFRVSDHVLVTVIGRPLYKLP